jgi:peroxiredoxin
MKNQTDTLGIGSVAPAFSLPAANRSGTFSLTELLSRAALIVEFMRGTW